VLTQCALSQAGHKRTVKALLKRFAEINPRDVSHRCTVHPLAVRISRHIPTAEATPPCWQDEGRTALHCCFKYGHRELAEYLISKGADDTLRDSQVTAAVTCAAVWTVQGKGHPRTATSR